MSETVIVENENISIQDLPLVISERFKTIAEIDGKVKLADQKCKEAQERVDALIQASFFSSSNAINTTQDAVKALAEAQNALLEAQTMLFGNQAQMAEVMKYLLLLGASSIAMNRAVALQLEAKLKQAEQEGLSESVQIELKNVLNLLREQQSAFSRQDIIDGRVKANAEAIEVIHGVDAAQDETDKKHDRLLEENAIKDSDQDKKDAEHDKALAKLNKIACAALVVGAAALIVAVIGLFI